MACWARGKRVDPQPTSCVRHFKSCLESGVKSVQHLASCEMFHSVLLCVSLRHSFGFALEMKLLLELIWISLVFPPSWLSLLWRGLSCFRRCSSSPLDALSSALGTKVLYCSTALSHGSA